MLCKIASLTRRQKERGFTLVELAIVLGVSSLLLTGLWRLMSSGNTRTRDQVTAEQHRKIMAAVQSYLETPEGQSKLADLAPNGGTAKLPLPSSSWTTISACSSQISAYSGFCDYLPLGFYGSTTNPYNQTYIITLRKDDATPTNTVPKNYSFLVSTTGGQTIPDTSGSRIASLVGRDGGFLYAQNVCGSNLLCGSYGTWALNPTTDFGGLKMTAGHVGSMTYRGGNMSSDSFWLARKDVPGDITIDGFLGDLNTVQTDIALGGHTIWGILDASDTPNAGVLVEADGPYGSELMNFRRILVGTTKAETGGIVPIKVMTPCTSTSFSDKCDPGIDVQGDANVSGMLKANMLYAGQFIYNTTGSDVRLKTDIAELKGAAENLAAAKGYSFTLKSTGEKRYGVLAQEIEKYYPEIVFKDSEGMRSVDYMGLVGPLVAAIGELKHENESLKAELAEIKKDLAVLAKQRKAKSK